MTFEATTFAGPGNAQDAGQPMVLDINENDDGNDADEDLDDAGDNSPGLPNPQW